MNIHARSPFTVSAGSVLAAAMAFTPGSPAHAQALPQTLPQTPAERDGLKVLFIGNSHLFVNNVPAGVQRRLTASKGPTRIRTIAKGGARLTSFTGRGDVVAAIKNTVWDVVVLQEASVSFLTEVGRRNFHRAVSWFTERIPPETRIVLYQTWPWRTGSRYFRGQAIDTAGMWAAMQAEYARAARRPRITIAPVGRCWLASPQRASLYSGDGNHASPAGSRIAATIIARTIAQDGTGGC